MPATEKTLESTAKRRLRKGKIQDALIGMIALSGVLIVAIAAPNAARLFKNLNIMSRNPAQRFRERITQMRKKDLLKWKYESGKYVLELTPKGEAYATHIHLGQVKIVKPRKWDGMWRMVIFDIPERKRAIRDQTRRLLRGLGLYRLQDSVWVHPYDFEEIVTVLKKDLKVGSEIRYVIAAAIEWDDAVRKHFSLLK